MIIVSILVVIAAIAFYRSWQFSNLPVSGEDAVAAYAASLTMKQVGWLFTGFAGIVSLLQWIF